MKTRYEMQSDILDHIMTNILAPQNVDTIREAVRTYFENFSNDELQTELNERAQ
jgi:hypothetical protein